MKIKHFPRDIKFPFCEKDDLEKSLFLVGLATLLGKKDFSKLIFCLTDEQCGFASRKSILPSSGLFLLHRRLNTTLLLLLLLSRFSRVRLWRPQRRQPTRLPRPWDSPGKNTGVGCHALLQGIFPTQEPNPGLPHCRQILYGLSHRGSLLVCYFVLEAGADQCPWRQVAI